MENSKYRVYSSYLKDKYNEKVYRIPVNLPVTCPNRDGNIGTGGCTFCSDLGAGFESLSNDMSVKSQLERNMDYIGNKYNAKKFIAYFQNYTNTYMELDMFKRVIREAILPGVVEIAVSTRPDSLREDYLEELKKLKEEGIEVTVEMGLQTVNYKTLKRINRGHSLAEFIEAINLVKSYGLETCVHMILNLPGDDEEDIIEGAKILSALKVDGVKLHSLYIVRGTKMAEEYVSGKIEMIDLDEYVKRTALFLAYLNPDMVIQRLIGRVPEEESLFCNWNTSWWKIKDMIEDYMEKEGLYQGKYFDYLGGKALRGRV